MSSSSDTDQPTVSIDGFEVLDKIGQGGFSVVYRARQTSMNREVAVKVLNSGFSTDAERRRFVRECHALGQLSHHPNIVTVFNDAMTTDGRPCIVMELYRTTYRERVAAEGALPPEEVMSVGVKVANALQAAHDAGVLHRDLKPHNIFISTYDEPALGDFGISTIDDERSQSGMSGLSIAYAPPELLEDGHTDARSDVYSLAATLYQMVTGDPPFKAREIKTTLRKILTDPPPPIYQPDVSRQFEDVLHRGLAKAPEDRPENAAEFGGLLRQAQQAPARAESVAPPRVLPPADRDAAETPAAAKRPVSTIAAGIAGALGVVGLGILTGWLLFRDSGDATAHVSDVLSGVAVEQASDGLYEVSFELRGDAETAAVEVTRPASAIGTTAIGDRSPIEVEVNGQAACVRVSAVDGDGVVLATTDPICSK